MGEPRRLTPDVQQRIIEHVADGNYPHIAAQLAGIPARTFQRWLHDGREDLDNGLEHSSVARLALAVEKARAECVARKVQRVQEAGAKSWQADAWWLERNFPAMYGQRRDVKVEQRSVTVHIALPDATQAELLAMVQERIAQGQALLRPGTGTNSNHAAPDEAQP